MREQKIRGDFKKQREIISKKLEEIGEIKNKEVIEEIKKKAHEIYEDKNKEKEEKISELLAYLTTCYPEAVTKIISDEILPIFRQDAIELESHKLLETINDSVFKPAMQGKDVAENLKFFEKNLSEKNIGNIKTIVFKIDECWKEEEKKLIKKAEVTASFEKAKEITKKRTEKIKEEIRIATEAEKEFEEITIEKKEKRKDEKGKEEFKEKVDAENPVNIGVPFSDIEETLIGMTSFIKPHLIILNIVRQNSDLKEEDFDTETRRKIIDKLFDEGKIFTYDGTTYIGQGQINNIARSNVIPSMDKAVFIRKLDDFLKKFTTKEELFDFLGVEDEMEYRQLNYILDKYSGNRKKPSIMSESGNKDDSEKTAADKGKIRKKIAQKSKEVKEAFKTVDKQLNEELENIDLIHKKGNHCRKAKKNRRQK